ncbi:MAG: hypothetical protein IM664_05580 [Phenylobacterium sp.]|uniref:thymidylate synthase n=1 Tax=Phenylobacterium sp. TaxID=1871053 RepID=UPI0025FB17F4|nr:thymidylate synthase [Phenylobacterium sp.]MCA6334071.1 hypothetical protein [Phenylobacterium sp.]
MLNISRTNAEWRRTLYLLKRDGDLVAPRGQRCYELLGHQTRVPMNDPLVTIRERKLGYKFMAAEAYWILTGDDRVETIAPYSKKISEFSDDGLTFFGAYGPKIRGQLPYVVSKLVEDPYSRQAVINIWRENPPRTKDVPCTTTVQWFIRDGRLHCVDTMRSSDIILGWPYDIFNFSMLSVALIALLRPHGLNLLLGDLTLTAGSQHLYERDVDTAEACVNSDKLWQTKAPEILDGICQFSSYNEFIDWLGKSREVGADVMFEFHGLRNDPQA